MGNSAASNEAIYQAALITEQRALAGHQDALDIMQRLLASMGDDPLLVKTKENLAKILENPEVVTDEVFANIMSKTGEILDTNYDQQVQEVLGAARAKGVSGPALQVTLQKAKEARASAMANAYRDALIERASSGLKTNMDAITASSNLLTQLFDQQRVLTTDIANVMRETVEAPFRNYGVDDVQAGGEGGNGASLGGPGFQSGALPPQEALGAWGDRMAAEQAAAEAAQNATWDAENASFQQAQDARNAASKWNPDGTPKTTTQTGAPQAGQATTPTTPGQPGVPIPLDTADQKLADQGPAAGTGTFVMNGKRYTVDSAGNIKLVDYDSYDTTNRTSAMGVATPNANPLSPATPAASYDTNAPVAAAERASAMDSATIQAAVSSAMKPLSYSATAVQNQFAPVTSSLAPAKVLGAAYNNGAPYSESTLTGAQGTVSAGGGAAEATRGQQLVTQYGMNNVVGTTAGYGVRQPSVSTKTGVNNYGGAGTQYATPTGSASPGATTAKPAAVPTAGTKLADTYNAATDPYANAKTGSQASPNDSGGYSGAGTDYPTATGSQSAGAYTAQSAASATAAKAAAAAAAKSKNDNSNPANYADYEIHGPTPGSTQTIKGITYTARVGWAGVSGGKKIANVNWYRSN